MRRVPEQSFGQLRLGATPYLSWSRLSTYNGCGERFRLSYIKDLPGEPSGAAIAGKAMHEAIRDAEASRSWDDPDDVSMRLAFLEYFTEAVEQAGGPDACRWGGRKDRDGRPNEDYLWWIHHASDLFCRRYAHVRRNDEDWGIQPIDGGIEIEIGVTYKGHHIVGYLDAVMVDSDGEAFIRDWKTGRQVDPFQLGIYCWMLANSTRAITTATAQVGYLRGQDTQSMIRTYNVEPWAALAPRMFDDLLGGVEAGLFPLRPGPMCAACSVRRFCAYGATLEQ